MYRDVLIMNQIPFNKNNVESLSFDNLDQVVISDYSITSLDTDEILPYGGYVFNLTVSAKDKGVYRTGKLNAMIDGSSIMFPIGKWVFDVQDDVLSTEVDDIIDIKSSPVAGAGRNFIRPKVTISIGDEEKTVLGMSYYSGSMAILEIQPTIYSLKQRSDCCKQYTSF